MTTPATDRELLTRYTTRGDEAAFAVLVDRHLPLVHGVALRVTQNPELAREASQRTLIRLAHRAALVPQDASLPAWLHRMARHEAIDLVRAEDRRKKRELAASLSSPDFFRAAMDDLSEPAWHELAPVIDDLVNRLPESDRDVLLRRYYRNESHAHIASQLGLASEAHARQRAFRALEKLRGLLGKRGIATSSAALSALLPAHASTVTAVPAGLSASILHAAHGITPLVPSGLQAFLLTVNTSQKIALAGIGLLLLTAASRPLLAGGDGSSTTGIGPAAASDPEGSSRHSTKASTSRAATSTGRRPGPAGAEAKLERLRQILGVLSDSQRATELLDLLEELPAGEMPEMAQAMMKLGKNSDSSEFRLLLARWTKLDPVQAAEMAASQGMEGFTGMRTVMREWAASDPEAALAWIDSRGASFEAQLQRSEVYGVLARNNPEEAVKRISAIEDPQLRAQTMEDLYRSLDLRDSAKMEALLAVVPDAAVRDRMVGRVVETFSSQGDMDHAFALLQDHPGAFSQIDLGDFFRSWVEADKESVAGSMSEMAADSPLLPEAVKALGTKLMASQPAEAFALLDSHRSAATDEVVGKLLDAAFPVDRAYALSQVTRLSDPQERDDTYARQLRIWAGKDPAAAQAWMDANAAVLSPAVRERLAQP